MHLVGIIFFMSVSACNLSNKSITSSKVGTADNQLYKVIKIDSIEKIYLIYVKRNDSIFKIMSKKEKSLNCKQVKINEYYILNIVSWFPENQSNIKMRMSGVKYDGVLIKIERDGIVGDLYITNNIKGLCYIVLKN